LATCALLYGGMERCWFPACRTHGVCKTICIEDPLRPLSARTGLPACEGETFCAKPRDLRCAKIRVHRQRASSHAEACLFAGPDHPGVHATGRFGSGLFLRQRQHMRGCTAHGTAVSRNRTRQRLLPWRLSSYGENQIQDRQQAVLFFSTCAPFYPRARRVLRCGRREETQRSEGCQGASVRADHDKNAFDFLFGIAERWPTR
jgi:hypothetical protein